MGANATTRIQRLRVRSEANDSLLTRIQFERMLRAVNWEPSGLPAAATLCIRKLADPLPNSLAISGHELHPSTAWQEALSAAMGTLLARAVRPAVDVVSPGTEAVLSEGP